MKWTFRTLLQKSTSSQSAYSMTFYDGDVDIERFPIRGISFSSESSLRQFLDDTLRRKDSQSLIQQGNSTSSAIQFWQILDEETIQEIKKVAGSVL
jgi:hypothetical protein